MRRNLGEDRPSQSAVRENAPVGRRLEGNGTERRDSESPEWKSRRHVRLLGPFLGERQCQADLLAATQQQDDEYPTPNKNSRAGGIVHRDIPICSARRPRTSIPQKTPQADPHGWNPE